MKKEYARYNPTSRAKKFPFQFKTGKMGRAHRSNTLGSPSLHKKLKLNPMKWFVSG